ncbi:MAG TPA: FimV/HubP family polar landmark protein [Burkholderiales bacterium]|nr:FimV/HubP family polar landmark protein [Burkholderiales bacterium]
MQSGLGQPLRAEIEVTNLQRGEAESLAARIASADAFREAGVEYAAVVPLVRAALERRGDNRYVIRLSTLNPVEEPFVDLLVELNWASGRLVRQYTFLLDPAEYKGPQPIAAAPPAVTAPQAPQARPVEEPKPPEVTAAAPPAPAPTPAPAPAPAPAAEEKPAAPALVSEPTGTYEVKQGDTLGKIAAQYKPEGVTAQQMLVALYRANEDAFINKNMNLLRSGRVLNIPDRAAAETVAPPDANKIVNAQFQDFSEYRAKLGQAVATAPAPTEAPQQRATGRIVAKADEAPAPAKAAPRDELRISKAEAAKSAKAAAQARADDIAARDRAIAEANSRVNELEKNVKDLQKLLEMKNQQLADLQKQAQAAKAVEVAKAPEPPKAAPAPKPEPPKAEAPKPEPPKVEAPKASPPEPPAAAKAPEPPKPAPPVEKPAEVAAAPIAKAPEPEAPKAAPPALKPEPPKAAAAPPKKPAPPPPPEPSLLETVLDEPLYLAGGGGAILALLVGGYLWRKKRSAKLENSLLGVTTTDSSSVFGTTGGRSVDTGGSSLQTDFSQSGIGAIDTDEVDPVAEADVYMAYGRDAQAEEILKEALLKDPNRQAVRVKLLEIYAARKDLKAFETTAGEIYAATGGQGPEWQKAMDLGLSIDPTNPMYGGKPAGGGGSRLPDTVVLPPVAGAAAAAAATDIALDLGTKPAPTIDFDLEAGGARASAGAPDLSLDVASQAPADLGFDLDLGGDSQKPAEEQSDFSPSGTFIMDAATKKAVSDMVEKSSSEPGALSIDFELPGTKPAADDTTKMSTSQATAAVGAREFKLDAPTKPAPGVAGVDLGGISFDLGKGGAGAGAPVDARWQEVATKLDLAKAYEEMGDKDGARELLNEVMKEGDAAQQQQAKQMIDAMK